MTSKSKIIKYLILSKIKRDYYKLNFAITSRCNSRCKTCDVWLEYNKNPKISNEDLSLREIAKIFEHLPPNFFWLSFSGGEPFLRNDLTEICKEAVNKIPSLCLISIPSNGLLGNLVIEKTKKILQSPLPNLFLNFSLDGPEKIHDQIRGIPGSFKKTWETYEKVLNLSRKEPRLSVNLETTISGYNLNYLEDFFKKLLGKGHQITITIAHTGYLYKNVGSDKKFTELDHDGDKLKRVVNAINDSLSFTSPIDIIEKIYINNVLGYYKNRLKHPVPCTALKSSLAIDSKGNIIPCFMWNKKLSNVRDCYYNLEKFINENQKEILKTKNLIERGLCPNCWTPCEAYQGIIQKFI